MNEIVNMLTSIGLSPLLENERVRQNEFPSLFEF